MNEGTVVAQASPPASQPGVPPGVASKSGGGTSPEPAGVTARATFAMLVGAVACAIVHYTFGDWISYPHVALWREHTFWASIPVVVVIPLLHWIAWSVLSLGRLKPARIIFVSGIVLCLGDLVWFLAKLNLSAASSLFKIPLAKAAVEWEDLWPWWMPVVVLACNLFLARRWWQLIRPAQEPLADTSKFVIRKSQIVGVAALFLGCGAAFLTAIHLILPQMAVRDLTLSLADALLVPATWRADFEFLAQNPVAQGKRLGAILAHAELAHLQRQQFYQALEESIYLQFVLSPVVDTLPVSELDWRRTLWENFFPRVRREHDPALAAQTVVRYLRERVGIDPSYSYRLGVETIWTQQMTDEIGFERVYVAALRSVGIAARLGDAGRAELWTGNAWHQAPRPIIAGWPTGIEQTDVMAVSARQPDPGRAVSPKQPSQ
jgi:Transglutaminase-like superfamily